jgi:hypothetical protein
VAKSCRRKLVGRLHDGTRVYQASGACVRRGPDTDFTEGCHHRVDHCKFIPKNEIWVERMIDSDDEKANAAHEISEYLLMRSAKMSYDKAHEHALRVERMLRRWPTKR